MRLLELEFAALGPYPNREFIDFRAFEDSKLFLLRGATGTGKSTIIDAITFALYGRVAGGTTSTKARLRSLHAAPDVKTKVRLQFEVHAGTFEVTRRPSYLLPGRKNETAATVDLARLVQSDGETIERVAYGQGAREVNPLIEEILGLDYDQFRQTVILPQGRFAEFIQASPLERKRVLASIFQTDKYERLAAYLKERAREASDTRKERVTRMQQTCAMLGEQVSEAAQEEMFDKAAKVAREDLDERLRTVAGLEDARTHTRQLANELNATYGEVKRIKDTQAKHEKAKDSLADLKKGEAKQGKRRERLRLDQEAATLSNPYRTLTSARKKQSACETKWEQRRAEVAELDERLRGEATLDEAGFKALSEELTGLIATLRNSEKELAAGEDLRGQYQDLLGRIEQGEKAVTDDQERLEKITALVPKLEEQIAKLEEELTQLPDLKLAQGELTRRLKAVGEADKRRGQLEEAAARIKKAAKNDNRLRAELAAKRQEWLAGSAARLAQTLTEGEACPVCGSCEHPQPASDADSSVSEVQLANAEKKADAAKEELQQANSAHKQLVDQIAALNEQAGADRATLEMQLETCEEQIRALEAKKAEQGQLKDQRTTLARSDEPLRKELDEARVQLASDRASSASLREQIEALEKRSAELSAGWQSVKVRREECERARRLVEGAREAGAEYRNSRQACEEAQERFTELLAQSVFEAEEEVDKAILTKNMRERLTKEVSDFDKAWQRASDTIEELEASGVLEQVTPDLKRLVQVRKKAAKRAEEANERCLTYRTQTAEYQDKLERLEALQKEVAELDASSEPLRRLAELADGAPIGEGRSVSLDTWVLLTQFSDVLAAANPHLEQFSSHRYQLERADFDAGSRSHKVGLGVSVFDGETEQLRSPSSLSGGETFYTSLALALGLMEVISSQAGGVECNSMIIDEGFGSLDSSRLDEVMVGLKALSSSGRSVGLVSHVAQMRQRIRDGIEVESLPSGGSTLRVLSS